MTGVVEGKLAAAWVACRTLHSPVKVATSAGVSYTLGGRSTGYTATFGLECSHCRGVAIVRTWPCATTIPAEVLGLLRDVHTDEGCLIWWRTPNRNLEGDSPADLWANAFDRAHWHAHVMAEARRLTGDLNG